MLATVGPNGVTWLRLSWAALLLLALARPKLLLKRQFVRPPTLGLATAGMAVFYFEAAARLPLGLVTTIEFLGPLGVAIAGTRRGRDLLWAALAAVGVLLLVGEGTMGGRGDSIDAVGLAFAVAAAVCWASYILCTRWVGGSYPGLGGLALALVVAAIAAAPFGIPEVTAAASWRQVVAAGGLAILAPLLPYALEMMALRRLSASAFSVLMSMDPAVSALVGFLVAGQRLAAGQLVGIGCVMTASLAANAAALPPRA